MSEWVDSYQRQITKAWNARPLPDPVAAIGPLPKRGPISTDELVGKFTRLYVRGDMSLEAFERNIARALQAETL